MSERGRTRLAAAAAAGAVMLAFGQPAGGAEVSGTDTVPPGLVQVEADAVFLRDASGERPVRRFLVSPSLRLGLAQNLDLFAGGDLFVRERGEGGGNSGLGDTTLQLTWRLADDEGWRPSLGLVPFVKIPTASGSKGLGSGRVDFGGIVAAGKDLPWGFHVDGNLGLTGVSLTESPGGLFLQRTAGAAVSWAPTERIVPYWEIFYASRDSPAALHSVGTDVGVSLGLHRRVRWEVSVGLGLSGANPDWTLFSGLTFLLGPLPEEPAPGHRPPRPIREPEKAGAPHPRR